MIFSFYDMCLNFGITLECSILP